MISSTYFIIIFISTILIIRLFLYFKPISSPTIEGFRLHHYMYGLILIPIGMLLTNITIYAVGLGLLINEFPYILLKGKNHKDNYSIKSLLGVLMLMIVVVLLKDYLIFFYE